MEKNVIVKQKARDMGKWFRNYYNEMENFIADLQEYPTVQRRRT